MFIRATNMKTLYVYMNKLLSNDKGSITRYWSPIDEVIREAVVLRGVKVRLLISFWKKTHPLTFNFVTSLKSLCMHLHNCSLEVVCEFTQESPNTSVVWCLH